MEETTVITVRVPVSFKEQFRQRCEENGMGMSQAVRMTLAKLWELEPVENEDQETNEQ